MEESCIQEPSEANMMWLHIKWSHFFIIHTSQMLYDVIVTGHMTNIRKGATYKSKLTIVIDWSWKRQMAEWVGSRAIN